MKGVVLAGGLGQRLLPMTRVTNKHLLPVYDRPMIYYPLQQLAGAGVRDVMVVTGDHHAEDFRRLLGAGDELGLSLRYGHQEGHGGIAAALGLAEAFVAGEAAVVLLGDNLFQEPLADAIEAFRADPSGALILLKEVQDPERFGVARMRDGAIEQIVEKPRVAPSRLAVTGCYLYDARVFDVIRTLEPSERGELEITDVNNRYLAWGALRHRLLEGWWTDAGTVESLHRAATWVAAEPDNPVLRGAGVRPAGDAAPSPAGVTGSAGPARGEDAP